MSPANHVDPELLARAIALESFPSHLSGACTVFATPATDSFPAAIQALAATDSVTGQGALAQLQAFLQKLGAQLVAAGGAAAPHFHVLPAIIYLWGPAVAAFGGNFAPLFAALIAHGPEIYDGLDLSILKQVLSDTQPSLV